MDDLSFRWDHGDTNAYYNETGFLLYPIYCDIRQHEFMFVDNNKHFADQMIEKWYKDIVNALTVSALRHIPRFTKSCLKSW